MKKFLVGVAALCFAVPMSAQQVEVSAATHHDSSPPLWNMHLDHSNGPLREQPEPKRLVGVPDSVAFGAPDPALSQSVTSPSILLASPSLNFDGVGIGNYTVNSAPPDTNGAVGATQYVQWVNTDFAVFDKASGLMASGFPKTGNTIWSGFGGPCQQYNDGDPIVQYDKANGRWILTQFAVSQGASGSGYMQCVAVSQTSDATGAYNRYAFAYGTNFNDYPKMGVGTDGNYYITFNMFKRGRTFAGAQVCAYNGAAMRAGSAATQACFNVGTSYGGILPADIDGPAPYRATDEYVINFGANSLNLWKVHADFATSSFSISAPANVAVAAFSKACSGGTCIPQAGTTNQLDSLADRLMYRFARRQNATGESYVVNHSVTSSGVAGVRWYQITTDTTLGAVTVAQQGTFQPDSTYRWMGSIATDKVGNIVLGYSRSSSATKPEILYTVHAPADAPGTMPNGETSLFAGAGSQTGTLHRWGDYSSMSVDPVDDCTMWYTTEYLKTNGSFNWSTRIGAVKQSTCQ